MTYAIQLTREPHTAKLPRLHAGTGDPWSFPVHHSHFVIRHRRGTALVFILGILTLVALVGLVLISRTHTELRRVTDQATGATAEAAMNGVVRTIQDTLRRDLWGSDASTVYPLTGTAPAVASTQEQNEPWDAPGPDDRWLASITPYMLANQEVANPDPDGNPKRVAYMLAVGNPVYEEKVLAWPYVSYLGSDLLARTGLRYIEAGVPKLGLQPFTWAADSRAAASVTPQPVFYNAPPPDPLDRINRSALEHVPVLQTPPPGITGPPIPGSTTNRTIAQAKLAWQDPLHLTALTSAPQLAGRTPRFPYFDTNADGIIDLYDADGDGIPDSPLSMIVPLDSADRTAARELYAAIRIVDHSGMLNVNAGASLLNRNNAPVFNESDPDFQRRGRRIVELLLDSLAATRDVTTGRTSDLVDYRWNSTTTPPDPTILEADVIRRVLCGGISPANYLLYGLGEEASMRHRGTLVPFARRGDASAVGTDFTSLDKALQWTTMTCRTVTYDMTSGSYYYDWTQPPRWCRFNSDYQAPGTPNPTYEGYTDSGALGWRDLLREDEPFSIKRHLLTTVSHATAPPPRIATAPGATLDSALGDLRVRNMDWPVLHAAAFTPPAPPFPSNATLSNRYVNYPDVPEHLRAQPVDLNMSSPVIGDREGIKWDFIRYAAAAIYMATESAAGQSYQGIPLTPTNREYLAWQFALNLADYRDDDNEPTSLEWPAGSGRYLFGVEMQPFFTEAYAHLIAGDTSPPTPDRWFYAVELYVPPYWRIPTENLYIRSVGGAPAGLAPLSQFQKISGGSPPGGAANLLDGGTNGRFIVLCGQTTDAPGSITSGLFFNDFYRNSAFEFDKLGDARVELVWSPTGNVGDPLNHTLDVIGRPYSGDGFGPGPPDPNLTITPWARRPPAAADASRHQFSMVRSTNGWRFTTAWHAYKYAPGGPAPIGSPGGLQETLGRPNEPGVTGNTTAELDSRVPPVVWPGRGLIGNIAMVDGFSAGRPYNSFDSVGDLGRMLMIGPIKPSALATPTLPGTIATPTAEDIPATALLAALVFQNNTSSDLEAASKDRLTAGHLDLPMIAFRSTRPGQTPWTARLFELFTTQSTLFDGIDNDGDNGNPTPGGLDFTGTTPDLTEGLDLLYRVAGRINMNTAPASVLRCVPFVSLLPNSPEYLLNAYGAITPPASFNPYAEFQADPRRFWDIAGSIVARRENRPVPLRLVDTDSAYMPPGTSVSRLRPVASVDRRLGPLAVGSPPGSSLAFQTVADLAVLSEKGGANLRDTQASNHSLFWLDRFTADASIATDLNRALGNHKLATSMDPDLGRADAFSPDFRYRRTSSNGGETDYSPIPNPFVAARVDPATARGRDVFLSRWANLLTTRSDVFTAYIALIDENGNYVRRGQVTLDRSDCFREFVDPNPAATVPGRIARFNVPPKVILRSEGSYGDDSR